MGPGLLWFCHWSTLGVCAALKLPQISALLAARGARGLSVPSLLLELAGFLVFLRYQCYYGYPLLTYLEYPIIIAQGDTGTLAHPPDLAGRRPVLTCRPSLSDIILLLCIFHFKGNVKQAAPYFAVFLSSWFVLTLQKWIIDLAMNLSTFISAASKFAQLQYLWKTKDSGAVSALTWSLSSYTCATRIVTTLMTTNDLTILIRFVIMLALNIWVTATILHYRKMNTVKTE